MQTVCIRGLNNGIMNFCVNTTNVSNIVKHARQRPTAYLTYVCAIKETRWQYTLAKVHTFGKPRPGCSISHLICLETSTKFRLRPVKVCRAEFGLRQLAAVLRLVTASSKALFNSYCLFQWCQSVFQCCNALTVDI